MNQVELNCFNEKTLSLSWKYFCLDFREKKNWLSIQKAIPELDSTNYGLLMGLYSSLFYVPGMLVIGGVTDRVNRKNLILASGIVGGVLCALNYFANSLTLLIILKVTHGFV